MEKLVKLFASAAFLIGFWIFAMIIHIGVLIGVIWIGAKIVKAVWS